MSRKKIDLEYVRAAVGHPPVGTVVRVELTEQVEALIGQGIVVDLGDPDTVLPVELDRDLDQDASGHAADPQPGEDERPADTGDHNGPADPPTNPDEDVAPDGTTALPAKKTSAKRTARSRG